MVLCGGIANYTEPPPGPKNYLNLVVQRGQMEGFMILDYMARAAEAIGALTGWVQGERSRTRSTYSMAWRTRRRRCGGCSKIATRASSCLVLPSSAPQQMGLTSTTLSAEVAEAAWRKLEPSLAVGFN